MYDLGLPPGRNLILASASPRRRELLAAAGLPCQVRPAAVPELHQPGEPADAYVLRLARDKCAAIAAAPGDIVLGADTTVVVDGEILEKPRDAADARRMLSRLSGRSHEVMTGIALRSGTVLRGSVAITTVWFDPIPPDQIEAYAASPEPMDKAGAYAIQGVASRWVRRIEGCYGNVVGLPVSLVWRELQALLQL